MFSGTVLPKHLPKHLAKLIWQKITVNSLQPVDVEDALLFTDVSSL